VAWVGWRDRTDRLGSDRRGPATRAPREPSTVTYGRSARLSHLGSGVRPHPPAAYRGVSSRVAGKHCCFPAPSELHVTVARHAAQAFTNAPRGTRPLVPRPSRFAPGADGPYAKAHDREPHQRAFLPPTYLLVSLSRLAAVLS
jgi:hypothetical protein